MVIALKVVAIFWLLFWGYAAWRILKSWNSRNTLEKAIWFVVLATTGGIAIAVLFIPR
jgi:hypothetical protein